jgi:pimeloyl-ACP methyl ester carboxylesterase
MGDSTFSTPAKDDDITIESLARDIVFLVDALQWKEVSVCGFSMGGMFFFNN